MSGNPKPKGREFNPLGNLVGTQAFKVVNITFISLWAFGGGLAYLYFKYRYPYSRLAKWAESEDSWFDDSQHKCNQAALERIREAKRIAEDPLYKYSTQQTADSSNKGN